MARSFSRRTVLRGFGAAIALPWLDSLAPIGASGSLLAGSVGIQPPRRMMFVYVPNGAVMKEWTPALEGADYELPPILEPLAPHKQDMLVISGLAQKHGEANGDGPGDHARASASYLTGAQPRKTAAVDIRAGVSVDQIAAKHLGQETRLPSMELGCDKGRQAGSCDSGYSCAYQFNLAWKTPTLPLPPEVNPRAVFERLFATSRSKEDADARVERQARRRSVLDFAAEDARRLKSQVASADAAKLDQYLDSVREIERRIEKADDQRAELPPGVQPIDAIPEDYAKYIRLMFDLSALSFQTDTTRVITLMIAHDGSNRSYGMIGVPDGHHDLSHHGGNEEKLAKIAKINRFHVEQFAYFVEKLKSIREGEGTLLDSSMITYGSGLADGNAHEHRDLPLILAGRGGGTVRPGRHVRYERNTPMNNLFLSMLERIGAPAKQFGDSTGTLDLS